MTDAHKPAPTMAWNPEKLEEGGYESRTFNHPSEVPEGWLDTHPEHPSLKVPVKPPGVINPKGSKAPEAAKVPLDMTRKEITAALDEGGVKYDPQAKVADLYPLLTENVKKALLEAEIEFDPNAGTKALLALLTPAE